MNSYEKITYHISGINSIIYTLLDPVWQLLHDGMLIRRVSLGLSWFITFEAYHFCYKAAEASGWDPAAIGACIGILTPVSGLQAAVLKFYNDGRNNHKEQ